MLAKTVLKIFWVVGLILLVFHAISIFKVENYSVPAETPLNIRITPLKRIKVIQLVESEEEFPVEFRFVNSTRSFGVYSSPQYKKIHESEETFGGLYEVSFMSKYDGSYEIGGGGVSTSLGVRSASPFGVEISPSTMDAVGYLFLWVVLFTLSGSIIFIETEE